MLIIAIGSGNAAKSAGIAALVAGANVLKLVKTAEDLADGDGCILRGDGSRIHALHVCGELIGGVFGGGCPGGFGLTSGTVIGLRAGRGAAA